MKNESFEFEFDEDFRKKIYLNADVDQRPKDILSQCQPIAVEQENFVNMFYLVEDLDDRRNRQSLYLFDR